MNVQVNISYLFPSIWSHPPLQQGFNSKGGSNFLQLVDQLSGHDYDIIGLQETETQRVTSANRDIVLFLSANLVSLFLLFAPYSNLISYFRI